MRIASIVAAAALVAASLVGSAGCTTSGDVTGAQSIDGSWTCTQADSLTYSAPPGSDPVTSSDSASLAITEQTNDSFTAVSSTDAGTSCPLSYTGSGSTATLVKGQSCVSGALTFSYSEGSLNLSGDTLNASLAFAFTGLVNGVSVAGSGTTTFACTSGT